MPAYSQVAVINQSTVVSDADGTSIVSALNSLLPTFCKDWSIQNTNAIYVPLRSRTIPSSNYRVFILDTTEPQSSLTNDTAVSDIPSAKVYAKVNALNGGVTLYEPTRTKQTLAQAVSHEVFEMLADTKSVNWWMNINNACLFAGEVVDPVEANVTVVRLPSGVTVGMSDWILPAWSDVRNTAGPFNHLDTLVSPFSLSTTGYSLCIKNGKMTVIYGSAVTPANKIIYSSRVRSITRANSTIPVSTPEPPPVTKTMTLFPIVTPSQMGLTGPFVTPAYSGPRGATGATGASSSSK